jgi:predicted nucleic acid-binding protein
MASGGFEGVTSILTLMELIVKPLQMGRVDVANDYEALIGAFPHLLVAEIDRATSRRAAELRAAYRLRPVDALQIAACLDHGATALLTNDRDLRSVGERDVVLLDDFVSYGYPESVRGIARFERRAPASPCDRWVAKLDRPIAGLAGAERIAPAHVSEVLQYWPRVGVRRAT